MTKHQPNYRYPDFPRDLFSRVETHDVAYLLGWIASDGSVRDDGSVTIALHEKDAGVLEMLRNTVCRSLPIKRKKNTRLMHFSFHSKEVVKRLKERLRFKSGQKDFTLRLPELPRKLLRTFLTGMFDGDGWVDSRRCRAGIATMSRALQRDLSAALDDFGINHRVDPTRGIAVDEPLEALRFLGALYDNNPYRLDRKYQLYLRWRSFYKEAA